MARAYLNDELARRVETAAQLDRANINVAARGAADGAQVDRVVDRLHYVAQQRREAQRRMQHDLGAPQVADLNVKRTVPHGGAVINPNHEILIAQVEALIARLDRRAVRGQRAVGTAYVDADADGGRCAEEGAAELEAPRLMRRHDERSALRSREPDSAADIGRSAHRSRERRRELAVAALGVRPPQGQREVLA